MQFSYKNYFRSAFVIPLILVIIVLVIIVFDILKLTGIISFGKKLSVDTIIFHCCVIVLLSLYGISKLTRSYSLAKEKETDAVSINGIVQDVTEMPFNDKYYVDGKVVWSQYIVIDNIKYYCMTANNLEKGMSIEIKYLPTSRFVLELEIISSDDST